MRKVSFFVAAVAHIRRFVALRTPTWLRGCLLRIRNLLLLRKLFDIDNVWLANGQAGFLSILAAVLAIKAKVAHLVAHCVKVVALVAVDIDKRLHSGVKTAVQPAFELVICKRRRNTKLSLALSFDLDRQRLELAVVLIECFKVRQGKALKRSQHLERVFGGLKLERQGLPTEFN